MKKATLLLNAALLVTGLGSCQKENDDVTIISPVSGDFVGKETCAPSPAGGLYAIHVYNTAANNGQVFVDNIYDIHNKLIADVSGNKLTIAPQTYTYVIASGPGAGTYTGKISGTGMVEGKMLTLSFELDGDLADKCSFVGDRDYRYPTEGN